MLNSRISVVRWLWTHNPFYAISALLMLYGVRVNYGEIDIGTINCWVMMGVLGAYTLVLATVGVLIVRWGKVWDDARSILLLLLLLFLAVSVSADDLFVKMESGRGGAALMGCGFGFSVAVLLGVLHATRIRLKFVYVGPLVLFLALFFVAPWWCSPELHPQNAMTLNWTLFLFPQIAGVLVLSLIPAVRMGQLSVRDNGTPWPWPLFPWSAFVFIGVAVVLRSYALTLTFSPSGPIWTSPDSRIGIVFDTVWRPYFLVPFSLAVLILIIEAGFVRGNRRLVERGLLVAPGLLLLAWPWSPSEAMLEFLTSLTWTLGSPVWLTTWMLIAFYSWATIRRAAKAEFGLFASVLVLSVVGTKTISVVTLTTLNPIPLFLVGAVLGVIGMGRRSSSLSLAAAGFVTTGVWILLPETPLAPYRVATCYHIILAACLLMSVAWHDPLAKRLQLIGASMLIVSACLVLQAPTAADIPWEWRMAYVAGLSGIGGLCARASRSRAYWTGFVGTIAVLGYAVAVEGYRSASSTFGRSAVAALSWSVATLIIGVLISAHKARWLPPVAWLGWFDNPVPQMDADHDPITVLPDESNADRRIDE